MTEVIVLRKENGVEIIKETESPVDGYMLQLFRYENSSGFYRYAFRVTNVETGKARYFVDYSNYEVCLKYYEIRLKQFQEYEKIRNGGESNGEKNH